MPALPTPTKIRKNTKNSQPGTNPSGPGVKTMMPVGQRDRDRRQDEHCSPPDPVAQPTPEKRTGRCTDAGGQQDCPALPIGQRPLLGQCRSDVANQKEIEEI